MPQDLSAVAWPVRTARLSIRPATADDVDATWAFRRLPEVDVLAHPADRDREVYAEAFLDPDRLAKTLVVERDGAVIGDLMLAIARRLVAGRGRRAGRAGSRPSSAG